MNTPDFASLFSLQDLWQTLQAERRPIFLYGMGNGADKILAVTRQRGIPVAGVFASDGFARGQSFQGMPVRAFSEIAAAYPPGSCVVLLAFGSARPEVLSLIEEVAKRYELYVPDVPVCGDTLFDAAFFSAHEQEFASARALFPPKSQALLDLVLAYKLTGRYDYLMAAVTPQDEPEGALPLHTVRHAVDLGAYTGDTLRELLELAPLKAAVAVEPDRRNFKKLQAFAESVSDRCAISCHKAAALDRVGEAAFDPSGNRNAGLATGRATMENSVATTTVDTLLAGVATDYIKYDVEGAEHAALLGTAETLRTSRPMLKVAAYHRSEDLFDLPVLLHRLAPDHRLYLVRRRCVPAWDLDIIALPN
ncbi:MAG: FkbM family methyltransferase [Ruminococcaceae bacterium]|nr:FkbM family methyltransferase [Oscillospiraceae bacterium]